MKKLLSRITKAIKEAPSAEFLGEDVPERVPDGKILAGECPMHIRGYLEKIVQLSKEGNASNERLYNLKDAKEESLRNKLIRSSWVIFNNIVRIAMIEELGIPLNAKNISATKNWQVFYDQPREQKSKPFSNVCVEPDPYVGLDEFSVGIGGVPPKVLRELMQDVPLDDDLCEAGAKEFSEYIRV